MHRESQAKIGIQLGHSGRKGSTRLMWEGMDQPLPAGNWPVVGPSPLPYLPGVSQVPHELTAADLARIRQQFADAAARADAGRLRPARTALRARLPAVLVHLTADQPAHRRATVGPLDARLRYPLEVLRAIRAVWPAGKPVSVRISATDWLAGGITGADSVLIARAFAAAGADIIDVSTGQVSPDERPAFGRSYQTPFADRIRNQAGIPTMAVGIISSYDDVNSLLLAGRADLCVLGRAHLYDPNWTLHAAAEQGYAGPGAVWPKPWQAGARRPQTGRLEGPKPRLDLIRQGHPGTAHRRWVPG